MGMRFVCAVLLAFFFHLLPEVVASQLWVGAGGYDTSIGLSSIDVGSGTISSPVMAVASGLEFATNDDLASDPIREPSVIWLVRNTFLECKLVAMDPYQRRLLSSIKLTPRIVDITIDPTAGVMYGSTGNALYRIARDTGDVEFIANDMRFVGSLGFDALGNLYSANRVGLFAIDKSTGAISVVKSRLPIEIEDFAVQPESGIVYAVGGPPHRSLFRFDLSTGNTTMIGVSSFGREKSLAFTFVPETIGSFPWAISLVWLALHRRRVKLIGCSFP